MSQYGKKYVIRTNCKLLMSFLLILHRTIMQSIVSQPVCDFLINFYGELSPRPNGGKVHKVKIQYHHK